MKKSLDWHNEGDLCRIRGLSVKDCIKKYEQLEEIYCTDNKSNLNFWLGYYNLKKE